MGSENSVWYEKVGWNEHETGLVSRDVDSFIVERWKRINGFNFGVPMLVEEVTLERTNVSAHAWKKSDRNHVLLR